MGVLEGTSCSAESFLRAEDGAVAPAHKAVTAELLSAPISLSYLHRAKEETTRSSEPLLGDRASQGRLGGEAHVSPWMSRGPRPLAPAQLCSRLLCRLHLQAWPWHSSAPATDCLEDCGATGAAAQGDFIV